MEYKHFAIIGMLVFLQIFNKFVENFKSNDAVVE
jgi:hypothetical protein